MTIIMEDLRPTPEKGLVDKVAQDPEGAATLLLEVHLDYAYVLRKLRERRTLWGRLLYLLRGE